MTRTLAVDERDRAPTREAAPPGRVLHVSADYPDPLDPAKTRAIRNLLTLVPEIEHRVWSLNRVGWRRGVHALDFADAAGATHRAVAYGAPPRGLLLARFLDRLADWIAEDAARAGFFPHAVHAHKVSIEGLLGLALADRFGVPLIVSAQGDSDLKIVAARPDLRPRWRAVWRRAATALPFAPWTADRLEALLGTREGPTRLLPCPAACGETRLSPRTTGPVFRTGLHLKSAARKNLPALFRALGRAAAQTPDIRLDVIGGGDADAFARLSALAERHAPGRVRFLGAAPTEKMGALLNGACAMALPSRRESFGMVSVEALFGGAPCLISRGWGIDGYLPDGEVTLAVPHDDEAALAAALARMAREEAEFKGRLAALAASGGLDVFTRTAVAAVYRDALAGAARKQRAVEPR